MAKATNTGSIEIGQRLKKRRKDLKWTQECTAEKLGITITHYAAVENGRKDFSKELLIRMAKVFDSSTDYLLFGKLDNKLANGVLKNFNALPEQKREYAYRIISDLLEALMFK